MYSHCRYASLLAQRPKTHSTIGTRRETLSAFTIDYDTLDVVSVSYTIESNMLFNLYINSRNVLPFSFINLLQLRGSQTLRVLSVDPLIITVPLGFMPKL